MPRLSPQQVSEQLTYFIRQLNADSDYFEVLPPSLAVQIKFKNEMLVSHLQQQGFTSVH